MRKKLRLTFGTTMAIALSSIAPQARALATGAGCINAFISLSVLSSPLDFATLAACPAAAGSATINPSTGGFSLTGCIILNVGIAKRARIRVRGNQLLGTATIVIRVPSGTSLVNGADTISATNIKFGDTGTGTTSITIQGTKTTTLDIGGTINLSNAQPAGTYTGTATVTAECL